MSPPPLPATLVARPELAARLSQASRLRFTEVLAGAGLGKSTLLSSWAQGLPSAWYTLDESDSDPAVLFAGVQDAVRLRVPALSSDVTSAPAGPASPAGPQAGSPGRAAALAGLLSWRLEEVLGEDLVLVLDDVHTAADSPSAREFLEQLVRQAPARLHVIIASRLPVPFALERLRGQGQVLTLSGAELTFSAAEIAELAESVLGPGSAAGDQVVELQTVTGGWPAAVRMALEALQHRSDPKALGDLTLPGGALYDYLAREVLEREPRRVRELLRRAAQLDRFCAPLLHALGVEQSARALAGLRGRGLFLEAYGDVDGWYSLTGLVRQTVAAVLPLSPGQRRRLAHHAADWYLRTGLGEEAVRILLAAEEHDAAATLLQEHAPRMLAAGSVRAVASAGLVLPQSVRSTQLEEILGQAWQITGDWPRAEDSYRRAAGDAHVLPARLAWHRGQLHYLRGDYERALAECGRGELTGSGTPDEALLLAWTATAHFAGNDPEACRATAARAMCAAIASGDPAALAAAHTVLALLAALDGDRRANEAHYRHALAEAERAGDTLQVLRVRTNRSSRAVEEGAYAEALSELDVAVPLAEATGFAFFAALALNNRAEALLGLGRLEEALADFAAALEIWRRDGSRFAAAAYNGFGEVHRARGERVLAMAAYREALALAEASNDSQFLAPALAGLARLTVADDPAEADRLAERALAVANGLVLVRAQLADGWVAYVRGDTACARDSAARARAAATTYRDLPGLAEAAELAGLAEPSPDRARAHLEEAGDIWRSIHAPLGQARVKLAVAQLAGRPAPSARARLRALGVRLGPGQGAGLLAGLRPTEAADVAVHALGGFRVLCAGVPVSAADWQSRKARDAVKILVARRGRPVPRDVLIEHLWPGEDADSLSGRLSVALSTARTVLDPTRHLPADHYIGVDRQAVQLRVDHLDVDVETFLAQAEEGLGAYRDGDPHAARLLSAAESCYGGEFCEEDPYADWVIEPREQFRATYLAVVRALAQLAAAENRHEEAARYQLRLLEHDPYDEQAHLGLIRAHTARGRHGEARRRYRLYTNGMTELGVEAAPFPTSGTPTPATAPLQRGGTTGYHLRVAEENAGAYRLQDHSSASSGKGRA